MTQVIRKHRPGIQFIRKMNEISLSPKSWCLFLGSEFLLQPRYQGLSKCFGLGQMSPMTGVNHNTLTIGNQTGIDTHLQELRSTDIILLPTEEQEWYLDWDIFRWDGLVCRVLDPVDHGAVVIQRGVKTVAAKLLEPGVAALLGRIWHDWLALISFHEIPHSIRLAECLEPSLGFTVRDVEERVEVRVQHLSPVRRCEELPVPVDPVAEDVGRHVQRGIEIEWFGGGDEICHVQENKAAHPVRVEVVEALCYTGTLDWNSSGFIRQNGYRPTTYPVMADADDFFKPFLVDNFFDVLREKLEVVCFCLQRLGRATISQAVDRNDAVPVRDQIVASDISPLLCRVREAMHQQERGKAAFRGASVIGVGEAS